MNLLITGAWLGFQECKEQLQKASHEIVFLQWEKDPLPIDPAWVEGIIGNSIFLRHPIEQFTNLKYIQIVSAGLDRVPLDYVKAHNIELHNARGVYSIPMAEYAVGGVLQLYKKAALFLENQKLHKWEKRRDLLELYRKTVCIIGCGSIGTECAKRFQAFGCKIIGLATSERRQEFFDCVYSMDHLYTYVETADIVVLSIPLSNETRHLIDKECLEHFKQGAVLVNIARGAIVETESLLGALKEKLLGAVLDVFEEEPLNENNPVWDIENVIVTPHNSFMGEENRTRLNLLVVENLKRVSK